MPTPVLVTYFLKISPTGSFSDVPLNRGLRATAPVATVRTQGAPSSLCPRMTVWGSRKPRPRDLAPRARRHASSQDLAAGASSTAALARAPHLGATKVPNRTLPSTDIAASRSIPGLQPSRDDPECHGLGHMPHGRAAGGHGPGSRA